MYIQKIIYDVSCNLSNDSYSRSGSALGESLFDITKDYFYVVQDDNKQIAPVSTDLGNDNEQD